MLFDTAQNVRNYEMSLCAWSAIFNALSHVEQREHSYPGRGIHDSIVTVPVSAQVPNGYVPSANVIAPITMKALRLKEEGKERHSFQCNLVNLVDLWLVATAERAMFVMSVRWELGQLRISPHLGWTLSGMIQHTLQHIPSPGIIRWNSHPCSHVSCTASRQ